MKRSTRNSTPWRRHERGQIYVLITFGLTVLVAFMALAIDVGYLKHQKRRMQAAADSAALAGASELKYGTLTTGAVRDASLNGFTDGTAGAKVTVNNPPTSGAYAGDQNYVEAIVSQPEQWFFMRVLGLQSVTVRARAVADASSGKYCIYSLNPSKSGAAHTDGGDSLTSSCGLMVDSNSSTALTNNGSITASTVSIVGNYSGSKPSAQAVTTGVVAAGDPLAYLQPPTVGACNKTNYSISSGSATLNPGVYCGGITISGSAKVTANPGTYILAGGGLNVQGNGSLTGTGVTFYNTKTTGYAYQPIYTQDQAVLSLKAPTSGIYAGILFFQDRSISSTALNVLGADGGGTGVGGFEGALYFPTTAVSLTSGQNQNVAYTIVVADTISLDVNTFTVKNDYSSLANGSPIKATVLSE